MNNKPHVLIIEDDPFNAEVLGSLLAAEEVGFTVVNDHRHLPNTLEQIEQIDVIFLDLEMPGINGYELFEQFQEDPALSQIPVVACTVHTDQISQARRLGFHSFIGKPLRQTHFSDQLERILSGQSVWEVF